MDQPSDLIGSSPRRKEDRRLLVGAGRYLDDLTREGLLHLGVVRSLHAHARVLKVDTREALSLPGVVAAWSAADLPEAVRPILAGSEGAHKGRPFAAPDPVTSRLVTSLAQPGGNVTTKAGPTMRRWWPAGPWAMRSARSPRPTWS